MGESVKFQLKWLDFHFRERAYEIYTGTSHGKAVWKAVTEAGKSYDIVPYGTEALGTYASKKDI